MLRVLLEHDGANQRELAEILDVRPSSMTEMLSKLEGKGLLRRMQDETDQRVMRVFLTEEGKTAAQNSGYDDAALHTVFGVLSEDETALMLSLIGKLNAAAEESVPGYGDFPFGRGGGHRRGRHPFHGYRCGGVECEHPAAYRGNPHGRCGGSYGRG